MTPLATFAAAEFSRRRDALRRAVRAEGFGARRAERLAQVWLAIALVAGAEPAEAAALLEDWRRVPGLSDAERRVCAADELAAAGDRSLELRRARDAALAQAIAQPTDAALGARSNMLVSLGILLGVCPRSLTAMKEAA